MTIQPTSIRPVSPQPISETNKRRPLTVGERIAEIIKYSVLIMLAVSFVMPFYWMISSALQNDAQVYVAPPIWFPSPAFWSNFSNAWTSFSVYAFRHPEMTDTERLLNIVNVLLWR